MPRTSGRPLRSLPVGSARTGALLFLFLVPLAGCRENGTGPAAAPAQTVAGLLFAAGDTLLFDAWNYDAYNQLIPSSHTSPLWKVLSVNGTWAGAGGVTSIQEFSPPEQPPGKTDTLRFRFLANGDIEQYGFIAGVVMRREGVRLAPSWDRIAAFSLPTNATWAVGTADTAGLDTLRGTVSGDEQYFVAILNGVKTVFHGYGVTLGSLDLEYTIVVSDVPSAFLVVEEASTPVANGFLLNLASLTKH